MLCKIILNDYRTKRNIEPPTYHTFQGKMKVPFFVSSLVFNGVTYTGEVAKRKKEAEQLAARAVVQSLLGIVFTILIIHVCLKQLKIYL